MKPLDLNNVKFTKNGKYVNIDIKIESPKNLYKFYSLNTNNVKGVKNSTIFFSPNNLLNDVLEGNFDMLWDFDNFSKNEDVHENFKLGIIKNTLAYKKEFLRWRGVFSMSHDFKNELLWIHYTNESGFCFEFDVEKLNNFYKTNIGYNHSYFFPISYHNPITKIDFNEYCIFSQNDNEQEIDALLPIMYCLAVKEAHWDYEMEWRLLINHEKFNYVADQNQIINDESKEDEYNKIIGNNLEIDRNIITKVILAPRFFNNNRFNKYELFENGIEIYNIKDNNEGKLAYELLYNLKKHYSDCIFQINKVSNFNIVKREINFKIEIIDVTENYVKLKKIKL